MDEFYERHLYIESSKSLVSIIWHSIHIKPLLYTILSATAVLVVCTRVLSIWTSGRSSSVCPKKVPMTPYSIPIIGHSLSFFSDPFKFMSRLRDRNKDGIFAINIFSNSLNIISDPHLVSDVMSQKSTALLFTPIAWNVVQRFFGFPKSSKQKYMESWEDLNSISVYLMREPYLSNMMEIWAHHFQTNVTSMISFQESEVDLQLWERAAKTTYISSDEVECDLMALTYTLLGSVSVPAMLYGPHLSMTARSQFDRFPFSSGSALLEKYPNLLQNIYTMDSGMNWFMMNLPAWIFPSVMKAHIARRELWQSLDDQQQALDSITEGRPVDLSWGDLDDVSEFIRKRHELFKNRGFKIQERGDLTILWALTVNANALVFWQILYILSTPNLLSRVRKEVAPFANVKNSISIGKTSEAPKIEISPIEISKKCPLLKATYLETLRLVDRPWSVRAVAKDFILSSKDASNTSFRINKGSYVVVPHEIHMRDPAFFDDSDRFNPERFLSTKDDGTLSVEIGTIRPYGGGASMCKGRHFAERECLAFVAGVLSLWDVNPTDPQGWVIPMQQKASAVSHPMKDIRVRIKRRSF